MLLEPRWLRPAKRLAARWLPRYAEFRELCARQYGTQQPGMQQSATPHRIYLAISQMVARDMQRYHGVSESQLRIVYNGVDLERFSPELRAAHRRPVREKLQIADGEVLLLIVAHNFRLKGVSTLLRAASCLRHAGHAVRVVVAGGKRVGSYEALARRLGIGPQVTFLGSVDDPTPYYAAADVYVQPTFYDPCSLVVLEALACGLPVITTRFNGAGELLTAGREGSVIDDPADDEELAAALEPLMNTERRATMGMAARQLAEAHSFERNCRQLLAVYHEAAGAWRRAA
jgi:UDP-glucose:(heptosyl)LPS alpha-1,3-glucosyltransferase